MKLYPLSSLFKSKWAVFYAVGLHTLGGRGGGQAVQGNLSCPDRIFGCQLFVIIPLVLNYLNSTLFQ